MREETEETEKTEKTEEKRKNCKVNGKEESGFGERERERRESRRESKHKSRIYYLKK